MPKTFNNLWNTIIDFETIYKAYKTARKGKRYRYESLIFLKDLEENLIILQNELIWDMYQPLPMRQFYVFEPKKRSVSAPMFRDRVVHNVLVSVIEPLFIRRFVKESFACMVGRGTHATVRHVYNFARIAKRKWGKYYILKCDVSQYFPSVEHDTLKNVLRRTIRDKKVLGLLDIIIDSYETAGTPGRGIPIGSLTSQLFANILLDPLDHYIKEDRQVKYYARYMDDFIIIDHDKKYLQNLKNEIEYYLMVKLDLTINPKTAIFHERQGIDFCGYRIWPTHILPRKSTIKRAKRRLRKMAAIYQDHPEVLQRAHDSIQSFLGYVKHCSARKSTDSILDSVVFRPRKRNNSDETP